MSKEQEQKLDDIVVMKKKEAALADSLSFEEMHDYYCNHHEDPKSLAMDEFGDVELFDSEADLEQSGVSIGKGVLEVAAAEYADTASLSDR
jgi:hypothetical protein